MVEHLGCHQAQPVLVMSAPQASKLTSSTTQILRHPSVNRVRTTPAASPSPVCSTNKFALQKDTAIFAIPTPPASEQAASPTEGEEGGTPADPLTCDGCTKEVTKAAMGRHKKYSCSARTLKKPYPCQSCPKSYTRPDALQRHYDNPRGKCYGGPLRGASMRSTLNSSSGPGGTHAHPPIMPQTSRTPNSSESLPSPILPVPAAGPFANRGYIQPQFSPAFRADHIPSTNPGPFADPNIFPNFNYNFCPRCQHALTSQIFPQHPPPPGVPPTPSPLDSYQGRYFHSRPADPAPPENVPPLRPGYQPHPMNLVSQPSGEQLHPLNHSELESLLEKDQPATHGMQYSLTTIQADRPQREVDEQAFAFLPSDYDPTHEQFAPEPSTRTQPGPGNHANDQTTNTPHFPESMEFLTGPIVPSLEATKLVETFAAWLNSVGEAQ
ncbi:hypothetical protein BD779DRAFT_1469799 [Infundibulicybe gibba]|nr:hypothetical protein BD779DRAFT_1469799 [Infundibulicybe gibba]